MRPCFTFNSPFHISPSMTNRPSVKSQGDHRRSGEHDQEAPRGVQEGQQERGAQEDHLLRTSPSHAPIEPKSDQILVFSLPCSEMESRHVAPPKRVSRTTTEPASLRFALTERPVSEGCQLRAKAMKKAFRSLDSSYAPKLTCVICAKRHHIRIFAMDDNSGDRTGVRLCPSCFLFCRAG